MTNKLNPKLNQNSNKPSGNRKKSDMSEAEAELKKSYLNTPTQPGGRRGRGDKREVTKRIDEFFPRGAAGRREAHGPKSFSKAVMPRSGRRTTRQKTK